MLPCKEMFNCKFYFVIFFILFGNYFCFFSKSTFFFNHYFGTRFYPRSIKNSIQIIQKIPYKDTDFRIFCMTTSPASFDIGKGCTKFHPIKKIIRNSQFCETLEKYSTALYKLVFFAINFYLFFVIQFQFKTCFGIDF